MYIKIFYVGYWLFVLEVSVFQVKRFLHVIFTKAFVKCTVMLHYVISFKFVIIRSLLSIMGKIDFDFTTCSINNEKMDGTLHGKKYVYTQML